MATGNRPSILDTSRYCGLVGELSKRYGTGRAAVMGKVFHALCADDPSATEMLQGLHPDEAAEITKWHRPTQIEIPDTGEILSYEEAETEVKIAIDEDGELCDYEDPKAFSRGIVDMLWKTQDSEGPLVVVRDIKKQRWSVDWGPQGTLQLHDYGWMAARRAKVARYSIGLWLAAEEPDGLWLDGPIVDTDGFDGAEIWDLLYYAIANKSETGTTGAHCRSCWSRLHCPEWLLPGALVDGWARELCDGQDLDAIDPKKALELLLRVQANEDLNKRAKENLGVWAERHGGIVDLNCGKVWRMVEKRASEQGVSAKKLREILGDDKAEQYITIKKGSKYPDWRNR